MRTQDTSAVGHWLPRVLLGIGLFVVWAFGMVAFAFWWGSASGIGVLMLGLLVVGTAGGLLYKRYLDRQDRA
jgi:ABC-type uncharacterized transport system permease subunit